MRAPFSFLRSSGGGFDPASLSLSLFWEAPYASPTWTDLPSAGTSGGFTLGAGVSASNGTPLNGHAPADFNGTTQYFDSSALFSDAVMSSGGTLFVIYYARTAPYASAFGYQDPALLGMTLRGDIFLSVNSSGVRGGGFDASVNAIDVTATAGAGAWHAAHIRWDSYTVEIGVDGAWEAPVALVGGGMFDANYGGNVLHMGADYINSTAFLDGQVARVCCSKSRLADVDVDNLITSANARYGISI